MPLRTREAVPQEASAEMTLRYLPPTPRIEFDKEWLRQQFVQATSLRKVVRSASFTVQAQVVPAQPGQEVEASLQQNQKTPISQGPKIDHKVTLQPGENTLTLRAWNKDALPGHEDDETEQQTLVLIYEKREAPQILLQALEPGGVRAAHVAIEPGKVMTVNTSCLRVLGTVIPMDDLQRVE